MYAPLNWYAEDTNFDSSSRMDAPNERISSPLLGRVAVAGDSYESEDALASPGTHVRVDTRTSFEVNDPEFGRARNRFQDIDDDSVRAEGENQMTSYIWILVCCASISGLMFGEFSSSESTRSAYLCLGVDTAMSVCISSS